ncbi:hypothetical protein DFH07DRAFT_283324 [Mycena maculata]|uniref:FAD-binding domain-containing protein n=1 Tax=Mycena maculata TaxID=230809 RepID=A0AAD7HM25_9AGAR|nr:hypothetical protein DFH07DRAFT_283324 [Mycena maculata]
MESTLPSHTDVLIVGAGPAGLATAVTLLTAGVKSVVVLDALEQGQNISRAVVIHAQTMEELDTIACAAPMVERGIKASSLLVRTGNTPLLRMNFTLLKNMTRFPYATLISQTDTESALEDRLNALGGRILRPVSVTVIAPSSDPGATGITATLADGRTITASYVVGADGARSFVRKAAGIAFRDPKTNEDPYAPDADTTSGWPLIIADVILSPSAAKYVSESDLSTLLGPRGFLLLVPLPPLKDDPAQRRVWRMSCPPEPDNVNPPRLAYLQTILDAALGKRKEKVTVEEVLWSSRFRARSAVADSFAAKMGSGTIVLAGDAAHVHSPAGGQGMNLGIRDSIALARALADILGFPTSAPAASASSAVSTKSSTKAPKIADGVDARLRAYSDQRRAQAIAVIKVTKLMTWATGLKSRPARRVRNAVGWVLGRPKKIEKRMAFRLSGLPAGVQVASDAGKSTNASISGTARGEKTHQPKETSASLQNGAAAAQNGTGEAEKVTDTGVQA